MYTRPEGACEARSIRFTTQSERTIQFKATTRSARASVVKILRILLIHCSNFVQETPQNDTSASKRSEKGCAAGATIEWAERWDEKPLVFRRLATKLLGAETEKCGDLDLGSVKISVSHPC